MKKILLLCSLLLGGCVPDELASAARLCSRGRTTLPRSGNLIGICLLHGMGAP